MIVAQVADWDNQAMSHPKCEDEAEETWTCWPLEVEESCFDTTNYYWVCWKDPSSMAVVWFLPFQQEISTNKCENLGRLSPVAVPWSARVLVSVRKKWGILQQHMWNFHFETSHLPVGHSSAPAPLLGSKVHAVRDVAKARHYIVCKWVSGDEKTQLQ